MYLVDSTESVFSFGVGEDKYTVPALNSLPVSVAFELSEVESDNDFAKWAFNFFQKQAPGCLDHVSVEGFRQLLAEWMKTGNAGK